jgi:dienelactone hydrolase
VATRTFTFVDTSRPTPANGTFPGAPARTLVTEVWYPGIGSAVGAPLDPAGASYPVVMHSHGFLDSRLGERYLTEHLASHGYIVAAVDYPLSNGGAPGGATLADVHNQPGDLSFALDRLLEQFAGGADAGRVGASGLSLGGLTTLLATYHVTLRDPRIEAALSLAGSSCFLTRHFFQTSRAALALVHGDDDHLVPYAQNGLAAYRRARREKLLVALERGSHTGFSTVATLFDQSVHFDRIGCAALAGELGEMGPDDNPFAALGGPAEGIRFDPRRCPLPCQDTITDPSMPAARQHELTRIVATAFFDAYLEGDESARCFLRRVLRTENDDIAVRRR